MTPSIPDERTVLLQEIRSLAEKDKTTVSARLLTTAQVALLFGVSERTIRIWANKNWIPAIHTPSGHWKFPALEIAHVFNLGLQQGKLLPDKHTKQVSNSKEVLSIDE
jgi:Helix-turn-helix domain